MKKILLGGFFIAAGLGVIGYSIKDINLPSSWFPSDYYSKGIVSKLPSLKSENTSNFILLSQKPHIICEGLTSQSQRKIRVLDDSYPMFSSLDDILKYRTQILSSGQISKLGEMDTRTAFKFDSNGTAVGQYYVYDSLNVSYKLKNCPTELDNLFFHYFHKFTGYQRHEVPINDL